MSNAPQAMPQAMAGPKCVFSLAINVPSLPIYKTEKNGTGDRVGLVVRPELLHCGPDVRLSGVSDEIERISAVSCTVFPEPPMPGLLFPCP